MWRYISSVLRPYQSAWSKVETAVSIAALLATLGLVWWTPWAWTAVVGVIAVLALIRGYRQFHEMELSRVPRLRLDGIGVGVLNWGRTISIPIDPRGKQTAPFEIRLYPDPPMVLQARVVNDFGQDRPDGLARVTDAVVTVRIFALESGEILRETQQGWWLDNGQDAENPGRIARRDLPPNGEVHTIGIASFDDGKFFFLDTAFHTALSDEQRTKYFGLEVGSDIAFEVVIKGVNTAPLSFGGLVGLRGNEDTPFVFLEDQQGPD